jgi:hypothetical protein
MFANLKRINSEKFKYQYTFIINELKFFETGFKLKKVNMEEELIFVNNYQ